METNSILFTDKVIETSTRAEDVVMKHKTQLEKCNQLSTKNKLTITTEKTKSIFLGKSKIYCKKKNILTSIRKELKTLI